MLTSMFAYPPDLARRLPKCRPGRLAVDPEALEDEETFCARYPSRDYHRARAENLTEAWHALMQHINEHKKVILKRAPSNWCTTSHTYRLPSASC